MRAVGVFCGARSGQRPAYVDAAKTLGRELAGRGIGLVYGGGRVGMMGEMADAALEAGGRVVGVIPRELVEREHAHPGVSEMHVVDGMHERKALMGALSDGFAALPGGYGTLEEFFEVLTWAQLGFQDKPCCLVNVEGFFDALARHLDRAVEDGFLSEDDRRLALLVPTPQEALRLLTRTKSGQDS